MSTPKMGFEGVQARAQVNLGECLWEIHAAGMKILEFTAGCGVREYADNEVLRSAIDAMLMIVRKALLELSALSPAEYAKLPNGERILEVAEGEAQVWNLVQGAIPELVAAARELLEQWHQA